MLRKHWEKFIGFLLALSLVGPYGFTDDYAAIGATKDLIEMVKGGIAAGRPLLGLFAYFEFRFINEFSDFIWIHICLGIALTVLLTLVKEIFSLLTKGKRNALPFLGVMATVSTGGFIVLFGWGVELVPLISIDIALFGILKILREGAPKTSSYMMMAVTILVYQPALAFVYSFMLLLILLAPITNDRKIDRNFLCFKHLTIFSAG